MKKLTKIVATIGPVSDSEEQIQKLIEAGVNVFRFNFKHSTVEWHAERIDRVNKVAKKMGVDVGTLLDLQGPEIRINMPGDGIHVKVGEMLTLGESVFTDKTKKGFSCSHPSLFEYLKVGQHLLADDGAFTFTVMEVGKEAVLKSNREGLLKNRKSLRIPGANFPFPVLVDRDFEGLKLAQRSELDYIALSYARNAKDVHTLREEMKKYKIVAQIISKIEAKTAIDNLDEIIDASDGIMVARGDLGIELPIEEVPYWQKVIIKKSMERGIPVITATQMLQTMIDNPFPTRAEVSDVANATYDLTDAVMLSGESASGKYPVETVTMMRKIVEANELRFIEDTRWTFEFDDANNESMLCEGAYNIYQTLLSRGEKIAGFVVFTESGKTARMLSRYRASLPIFAFVPNAKVAQMLTVNYGVEPIVKKDISAKELVTKEGIAKTVEFLKKEQGAKPGEWFIVLHGDCWLVEGGTSTLKLIQI